MTQTPEPIKVECSVAIPVKEYWKLLVTKAGSELFLGKGGELGDKGDSWEAEDGSFGVVRSYHPLESIRFSWHAKTGSTKTMVRVSVAAEGDGTKVTVEHLDVPDYYDKEALAKRWEVAAKAVAELS